MATLVSAPLTAHTATEIGTTSIDYLSALASSPSSSSSLSPVPPILPTGTTTPAITPPRTPQTPPCLPLPSFQRNFKVGNDHPDVKLLQIYLNANGYTISQTGGGSPGKETTYLGNKTASALKK